MKRLLLIILAFYLLLPSTILCYGESFNYALIYQDNCYFYSDSSMLIEKFTIPQGFYVKVKSINDDKTFVSYQVSESCPFLEGYIKTCNLYFLDTTPNIQQNFVTLTISCDDVLFANPSCETPKTVLTKGQQGYFYGEYTTQTQNLIYIYSNTYIGYVRKSSVEDYILPETPSSDSQSESSSVVEKTSQDNSSIIIVVGIALISLVIIIFLSFKPEKQISSIFNEDK